MQKLILNETPIRTSKNYEINNIKLENIDLPLENLEFNNTEILKETSNITIEKDILNDNKLIYGLGEELTNQVKTKANQRLKLTIENKIKEDVQINFCLDSNNMNLIDNIEIVAKENSEATIIIKYEAEEDIEGFHNGIITTNLKNNSKINIILVNLLNLKTNNFIAIQNTLQEKANLNYTIVDFGGKNTITNYYSNIKGKNSSNKLNTIYLGKKEQVIDLNYIAEVFGEKSQIDIEVQGAIKDNCKKHFKGTIDFKKGCKKAKGDENEYCMLLSDKAKSIALPILLCTEEDVEGNHSTATGKVDPKELFYIMSRGFSEKEAIELMVRARFNKIIENIQNDELKRKILEEIDKKLT